MKKTIKPIVIGCVGLLILIFIFLIYKNLFAGVNNTRFEGLSSHKLANNEINAVKEEFKELDQVKKVKVYSNNKIINILVELTEDVDFDKIKEISNNSISKFSEKNLKFYDIEIFVNSKNKESEVYPKIGYKFKSNSEFSW